MPARVQLRRTKGWRMPAGAVKVDRTTAFGNPFRVGDQHVPDAAAAVRMFRARLPGAEFYQPPHPDSYMGRLIARLPELRGRDLACWCRPGDPCHADVLIEVANA